MEVAATKTTLPKYPAYKDSGVEWLGEIPEGWQVNRLKSSISLLTGYPFKSEKYSNTGVKLAHGINVKEGYFDWTDKRCWPEVSKELESFLLEEGDVLIAMDGSKVGKNFCQVKQADLPILLLQRVARLRTRNSLLSKYLYWNIVSKSFLSWVNISKTDPMVPHIAPKDINNFVIALPSPSEQTAIANFLDDKTAKIDRVITQKQQMIALLKERKQIIIQNAVTKGLDPNAKMKDSGVEWIGEIPEGWEVKKMKHACHFILDGTHGSFPRGDKGYRLLSVRNIIDGRFVFRDDDSKVSIRHFKEISSKFEIQVGDIQSAIVGATMGKVAIVEKLSEKIVTQRSLSTIRLNKSKCRIKFRAYFVQSQLFQSFLWNNTGFSAQPGIYLGTIQNAYVPIPPMQEQTTIVHHIETQSAKIGKAISLQQTQIEKLKEYKATLIDSAVTGKIKVSAI